MTPEDQKKPAPPPRAGEKDRGPLQILAPADNDTVANNFSADGVYTGAADGTSVSVTLTYTDPGYTSTEQSTTATVTGEYWTVSFSGVSVVSGRKYRVTVSSGANSDKVSGLTVLSDTPLGAGDSGAFSEIEP